ncbi:MAG: hypothetical protein Q8N26_36070 [Myxococcales bacterium]|nr:hypothetical protein [Myxococcales bacterium]
MRQVSVLLLALVAACATAPKAPPRAATSAPVKALKVFVAQPADSAGLDARSLQADLAAAFGTDGLLVVASPAEADLSVVPSLSAREVQSAFSVVVNGQPVVTRDVTLALLARKSDGSTVDQVSHAFQTSEPRVPPGEVQAALGRLVTSGRVEAFAALPPEARRPAPAPIAVATVGSSPAPAAARCTVFGKREAEPFLTSFKDENPVGLGDLIWTLGSEKWCEADPQTQATRAELEAVSSAAPAPRAGTASPRLSQLTTKALKALKLGDIELLSAVTTNARARLVNEFGVASGTTQRTMVVIRAPRVAACFQLRGDWRVSNLKQDQDDPEYVVFDRATLTSISGWVNKSGKSFQNTVFAELVSCPKLK